jgi:hypothetical protein
LLRVLNKAFDQPLQSEENAAMPLAGGLMQHGFQCGMVWGSALAAGAQAYRLFGQGAKAEAGAIVASRSVVDSFRMLNKHVNCIDLTGTDKTSTPMQMTLYFLFKGGTIKCMRMATKYAPAAFREINSVLFEKNIDAPGLPVSCSSLLARKAGASDLHTVMAAGLAGGIGLSGGACGALGAAIWIMGMNSMKAGADRVDYKDPRAEEIISRFGKCTGFEFECSKIVGRKFENVQDHAAYVRAGGCSKVLEALAAR